LQRSGILGANPIMGMGMTEYQGISRDEGLEVVAVNFKESNQQVRKFFDELGLTFIALLDKDGKVSEEYGVWSLPLSYFINRKGEFVGKAIGSRNWHSEAARNFFLGILHEKNSE